MFANLSSELEPYRKKKIDVKANSGSSVSFMIIPKELGYITIKATANSVLAGDSVEHKLLVKVNDLYIYIFYLGNPSRRNVKTLIML